MGCGVWGSGFRVWGYFAPIDPDPKKSDPCTPSTHKKDKPSALGMSRFEKNIRRRCLQYMLPKKSMMFIHGFPTTPLYTTPRPRFPLN